MQNPGNHGAQSACQLGGMLALGVLPLAMTAVASEGYVGWWRQWDGSG